jgi:hypothetical protein
MPEEPTFSPDGKFMWNGSEWIPSPPGYEPKNLTNNAPEYENRSNDSKSETGSRQILVDQVSQLVDSLESDHKNYMAQKKANIPSSIFSIGLLFYILYGIETRTMEQITNLFIIGFVIFIPINIISRRYYGLKGVKRVSVFSLSSKIKIIDPMMQRLETHEKMMSYVEICSAVRSNIIGKIILASIGTAVGAGALAVIASQMKSKSK